MLIYQAEKDAGLTELIQNSSRLAFASQVRAADKFPLSEGTKSALGALQADRAKSSLADDDLFYLDTVLVSVGWNKNDDVFDPGEVWIAKASPVHKPINYEHVGHDIVGHMVSSYAMDADGKRLADDEVVDALPAKFHVVTGGVLYRYYEDKEKQARIDKTLAEIAKGEWFVSMECLFRGFDYALRGGDGSARVVARNEQTAFLTKHLRVYGGSGTYGEFTVGRLLRNILFSGKGLVRNPANPESVILSHQTAEFVARAEVFSRLPAGEVYSPPDSTPQKKPKVDKQMEITVAELQGQLTAARAEIDKLKNSGHEQEVTNLVKVRDAAVAEAKLLTEQLTKAGEDQKSLQAKLDEVTLKMAEAEKGLAEVREELRGVYESQRQAARVAQVKSALKIDESNAEAVQSATTLAESLAALTDEKFAANLAAIAKLSAAPLPPKATPAQTPPAATPAKNPADATVETDDSGEVVTTVANLGAVTPAPVPALHVTAADGVKNLAKDVAAFLGYASE